MDASNEIFESAVEFHKKNDFPNAEKKYREYLKINPKNSQCLFILGTLLIQEERYKDAIIELIKSTREDPKNYHCFQNLGIAYFETNQLNDAIAAYRKSIAINPKNPDVYNNLGNALHKKAKFKEAIKEFSEALKLSPNPNFLVNRAKSYMSNHEYSSANEDVSRVDKSSSVFRRAEDIKALIYDKSNQTSKSIPIYESRVKSYDEDDPAYQKELKKINRYLQLINALMKNPDLNDKRDKYLGVFEKEFPGNYLILRLKSLIAFNENKFEVAIKYHEEALKLKPNHASIYHDLGVCYEGLGNVAMSAINEKKCLAIESGHINANVSLGIIYLRNKEFTKGWVHYEYRLLTGAYNTHPLRYIFYNTELHKWDGTNDKSSVLIYGDQGLGDQIILSKLLHKIKNFQNKFTIVVDPRLIPIFKRSFSYTNFNFVSIKVPIEGFFDYQAAIFRLGYLFVNNEQDIRSPDKFITANKLIDQKNTKKSTKLRCGVSWNSINYTMGDAKSLKLCDIIEATTDYDFEYINLQYGDHETEIASAEKKHNVKINRCNEIDKFKDIDGLYSLVDSCDVVISISNVTAHIAGSLGKKTYLLLARTRGSLWYWHMYRKTNTSVWYPSIELIKSTDSHSLKPCFEILKSKLKNISP